MKKNLLVGVLTLAGVFTATAQNVTIPDPNFKAYLIADPNINSNSDSEIQVSEATAFTGSINCNYLNISDFTGLEAFVNLTSLTIVYNPVTTLDVSQNTALTVLHVYVNALTSLDVSNNTALVELRCERNPIGSLDVSNLTQLDMLTCNDCGLTTLDVSNNPNLTLLDAGNYYSTSLNQLTTIDVSNNPMLEYLNVQRNQLTSINLSNNNSLIILGCGANLLTNINLSNLSNLTTLYASDNLFNSVDFSSNLNLETLELGGNPLTGTVDISGNSAIRYFTCDETSITGLNLANGHNSEFTSLYIYGNTNLFCVEVDDAAWSDANWNSWQHKDSWAIYSEDCGLGINERELITSIYPNPVSTTLNLNASQSTTIIILNALGTKVGEATLDSGTNEIDTQQLAKGIYFIQAGNGTKMKFTKN